MKNVIIRAITGLIYVGAIVGAILAGQLWMVFLVTILALLAIDEFNRISDNHSLPLLLRFIDLAGGCFLILCAYYWAQLDLANLTYMFAGYLIYFMVRLIVPLYIKKGDPLASTAHSFMGQLYAAMPMALLLAIYTISPAITLLMFIMIWLNDTGAFCVGSLIGRNRLFERISPKKSWEGFFGGLLFAALAGVIASLWLGDTYFTEFSTLQLGIMGIIVSVIATWGDLVESLIKRTLNIKDSGHLLPGHGGILDRIDSLLLVAPATLIFLMLAL